MHSKDRQPPRERLPEWMAEAKSLNDLQTCIEKPNILVAYFVPQLSENIKFPNKEESEKDYNRLVGSQEDAYIKQQIALSEGAFTSYSCIAYSLNGPWNDAIIAKGVSAWHPDTLHPDELARYPRLRNGLLRFIQTFCGGSTQYRDSMESGPIRLPDRAICVHKFFFDITDHTYKSKIHRRPPVEEGVRIAGVASLLRASP